jgi:tetratricopeptide (TPR) repeat protein
VLEDFYVKFLHKEREAGVSDMTAFSLFVSRRMGRIGQMAVPVGDSTYDMDISISGGFEMYNGTKKIYWINDRPYGKLVDSKRLVLFNIIHFPGGGVKWLMNLYGCENLGKYITDPAYLFEVGIVEGDLEYKVLAVDRFERMVMLHSAVVLVGRKEYGCLKRIFEGYLYKKPHDDEVAAWLREVNRVLGNTETLNLEGEKRFLKGDAGGAMQAFSGAAELSSDYVPAYSNLGVACYSLGKIDAAVRYFERAITIDPLHRDTVLNFGNVLIQLQRYEGARKIIEMYLCHEQNDGEARQLLEEVEQRTFRHSVCGEA